MDVFGQLHVLVAPVMAAGVRDLWVVGGAVRDAMLGSSTADVDLTGQDARTAAETTARHLGVRAVAIGSDPVTWRVVSGDASFDFAPLQGVDITADLSRRDFTLNALAVPLGASELVDPCGGSRDIEARVLRMVRPSNFDDDPLRVLRGVRFAATLDFVIDPETERELRSRAETVNRSAPERIRYELARTLEAAPGRGAAILARLGMWEPVLGIPEDPATLGMMARLPAGAGLALAIAILYHSEGAVGEILKEKRWPGDLVSRVLALLRASRLRWEDWDDDRLLAIFDLGPDAARDLTILLHAEGREPEAASAAGVLATRSAAWWETRPLLRGDEIARLTGATDVEIGRAVRRLLAAQLAGRVSTVVEATELVSS